MEREERREELEGAPEEVAGEPISPTETPPESIVGPGEPVAPPYGEPDEPFTPPPPPTAPVEPDIHAPAYTPTEPEILPPPPPPPPAPVAAEPPPAAPVPPGPPVPARDRGDESRGRQIVAVILILVGIWLLADQFLEFDVGRLWPVILIVLGLLLIFRRP